MHSNNTSKRILLKYNVPNSSSATSNYLKIGKDENKNNRIFNYPSLFQVSIIGCLVLIICLLAISKIDAKLFNDIHSYMDTSILSYNTTFSKISYISSIYNFKRNNSIFKTKDHYKHRLDGLIKLEHFEFIWQKVPDNNEMHGIYY